MGRFLDEEPVKTYKGKFLDDAPYVPKGKFLDEPKKENPNNALQMAKRFAQGGGVGYGSVDGSEDVLPMAGQVAGEVVAGYPGEVAGATAGQALRQTIRGVRGKGFKFGEIPAEAARTAATSGILRTAGKILSPMVKKGVNRMMMSVIKPSRDVIKRNPNIGLEAVEQGIVGTKNQMVSKAQNLIKKYEDAVAKKIVGRNERINAKIIIDELGRLEDDAIKGLKPEDASAIREIKDAFVSQLPTKPISVPQKRFGLAGESLPDEIVTSNTPDYLGMNLEGGQSMKKAIYNETPQASFNRQMSELPGKGEARRTVASNLRKQIGEAIPEIKPVLRKESVAINTRDALENSMANEQRRVLLPKLAGMGAGGLALAGNPLAGLGVYLGDAAFELARSAPVVTGTAKNMLRLNKFGRRVLSPVISEVTRKFGN